MRIAVIGAGMAGLSCATELLLQGYEVQLFEQHANAGGRLHSIESEVFQCDLGAPYFAASHPDFLSLLDIWKEQWMVDEWNGWLVELQAGRAMTRDDDDIRRFVGVPNMNRVLDDWASVCDVQYATPVVQLNRVDKQWELLGQEQTSLGRFDVVIAATTPAPARQLLASSPKLAGQIAKVNMQPSWVLVLGFAEPLNIGFDAAHLIDSPITWMSNNSSKPERKGLNSWVLQAGNEWTSEHLDSGPSYVSEQLLSAFSKAVGMDLPAPDVSHAYLWRESFCVNPLGVGALWHPALKLGACGDWCEATRVEGAFLSGRAMAQQVVQSAA